MTKYTATKMTMTIGDQEFDVSNMHYVEREPDLSKPLRTIGRAFGTFQHAHDARDVRADVQDVPRARARFNVRKAARSAWTRSMLMTLDPNCAWMRGAAAERAAIVAWLRCRATELHSRADQRAAEAYAECIERGDWKRGGHG